jgi:VWFA-related protein
MISESVAKGLGFEFKLRVDGDDESAWDIVGPTAQDQLPRGTTDGASSLTSGCDQARAMSGKSTGGIVGPAVRGALIAAVLAVVCVGPAPGVPRHAHARPPAATVQTPVFRAAVDLVVVEATAVARSGEAARGLAPTDFRAEIDGHPRDVVWAEFVDYDAPTAEEDATSDITANVREAAGRSVVVVVDQSSLRFESRGVLEGARRWLATLAPADRLAFVGLPAPGPLVDFTTDHAKVLAAFSELEAGVGPTAVPNTARNVSLWEAFQIVERNDAVRAEVIARECRPRDPICPSEIAENARAMTTEAEMRVRPVLSSLREAFRRLAALPGPKHVVLISSGWPIEGRRVPIEITELAAAAAASNVTVHTFTAEEWASSASLIHISPRGVADQQLLLSSVEALAGYTGGRSVRLAGNGEAAFRSLSGGLAGYYRLAVRPAPEDLDGKSRRIDLAVTRPGVSLLGYRRVLAGVTASRTPASAAAPAFTTPTVPAPVRGTVGASTLPASPASPPSTAAPGAASAPASTEAAAGVRSALRGGSPRTALALRVTSYVLQGDVDPETVRVLVSGEVTRAAEGPAMAAAALIDSSGGIVAGTERDLRIPATGRARVQATLTVRPGSYLLRVAVGDSGGRIGSLDREVYATWREAGDVTTTGLVLLRAVGGSGGPVEPLFDALTTADQLIVQVPLSAPPAKGAGQVVLELARDGPLDPPMRLVAGLGRTSSGAIVAEAAVPPSRLAPGRWTLTAVIEPGPAESFTRTFRVEPPQR